MILDQSAYPLFAQFSRFGSATAWTYLAATLPAVLGPYRIAAREAFGTGPSSGEVSVRAVAEGELFATGPVTGEVGR